MKFIQDVKKLVAQHSNTGTLTTENNKLVVPIINQTEIIAAERSRVQALDALNDGSNVVSAIVDDAKQNGKNAEEIKNIVDIVKQNMPKAMDDAKALAFIADLIADNKDSGANNIKGEGQIIGNENEKVEQESVANSISQFINKRFGRVK